MVASLSTQATLISVILGALVVHIIYNRYEIDPSHLWVTIFLLGAVPTLATFLMMEEFASILISVLVSFILFYATLLLSIIIYRISPFHPLASYPGPFLAKVSKLHGLFVMATGKRHIYNQRMHEKYGPYVRVGPNELSVVDADAIPDILGPSGLPKGPMWDVYRNPYGVRGVIAIRDMHEHARRRRPWNRALSASSVKNYAPILVQRALQLENQLRCKALAVDETRTSASVDLAEWLKYFTFDFMGDMAFGGGFETMRDGTTDVVIWNTLQESVKAQGLLQQIPWILQLLYMIPGTTRNLYKLRNNIEGLVMHRKMQPSSTKDLFHYLIDEDGVEKTSPTDAEVRSDGMVAIIAGSETAATALNGLFYYLLNHREDYIRLQREVDEAFPKGGSDPFDAHTLSTMEFLNAVINETLRICTPGNIIQRATTHETGGRWLGNRFVPEGTAVDIPGYTLFRDPRYFSPAAEVFWPDRWLHPSQRKRPPTPSTPIDEYSHASLNTAAFIPFSCGPANCAGRILALFEMRAVVALLMQRFEIRFDSDYDPADWTNELEDWFVMHTGKLPVYLTIRN